MEPSIGSLFRIKYPDDWRYSTCSTGDRGDQSRPEQAQEVLPIAPPLAIRLGLRLRPMEPVKYP
jgi:hypothetical protein